MLTQLERKSFQNVIEEEIKQLLTSMTKGGARKGELVILSSRQPGELVVFPSVHARALVVVDPGRLDVVFRENLLRLSNVLQHVEVPD